MKKLLYVILLTVSFGCTKEVVEPNNCPSTSFIISLHDKLKQLEAKQTTLYQRLQTARGVERDIIFKQLGAVRAEIKKQKSEIGRYKNC
jgi:hypothetical protein